MCEDDLRTGTDYTYNSNLESMVVSKKEPKKNLVNTLLDDDIKSYSDLSNEVLIRLKKEHEDLFDSLPQKNLPVEEQSDLEKVTREDYTEICKILKNRK